MLGANVGTTLIVHLLSFDLSSVTPALIQIGVLMCRRGQARHYALGGANRGTHHLGTALQDRGDPPRALEGLP